MSTISSPSTRRAFVGTAAAAGAALALSACGDGSSAAPNNSPSTAPEPVGQGVVVAAAADLTVGTRLAVSATPTQGDGAGKESGYLLFRPSESSVLAYTAICTHQGCAVGTKGPSNDDFYCSCHGSHFNPEDGKATAGPARAALERFAAQIEGENVLLFI